MKFSVVVPSLNGMPHLETALRSILDNARGMDVEIIVQDGGSTDGSIELAKKMVGPSSVHVEHDSCHENAINRGWQRATGDILAWLNADDYYESGAFQYVQQAWTQHPETRWSFGHFRMVDEQGREIRRIHRLYKSFLIRHYSYALLLVENIVPQMSVFLSRTLWCEAGPLMEGNWAFDYDYWLRLGRISRPLVLPETLAVFRWHPLSKTGRDPVKLFRDEYEVARRHTRNPILRSAHRFACWRNALLYRHVRW